MDATLVYFIVTILSQVVNASRRRKSDAGVPYP
jgi:hypothetical protein